MSVIYTSRIRIEKHQGPHRTAHVADFPEPINFGMHGEIREYYSQKYGRDFSGSDYPTTLDHIMAGVAG